MVVTMDGLARPESGRSSLVEPVIETISPNDEMVTPEFPETYFYWGESAVRCIHLAMDAVGKPSVENILDLPCGHGRVLRTLKFAFPKADLTACDLNRDGVDFCQETFGATGVYSAVDFDEIELEGGFDLIWVGSLFTHLSDSTSTSLLEFLTRNLADDGLLVFTVHGPRYAELIRNEEAPWRMGLDDQLKMLRGYDAEGFGYAEYEDQEGYGLSLSAPSTVTRWIQKNRDLRLVLYLERGWRGHQDVICCQRGFTTPDP
jgi:SAM-dependent methyltransferase